MRQLTLYGRPDCHLCDEAEVLLRRIAPAPTFSIEKRDISGDPELEKLYAWAIPVIVLDGVEIARAPIREERLRDALAWPPVR